MSFVTASPTAFGVPSAASAQETTRKLALGDTAPAVQVDDLNAKPISLGTWIGKRPMLVEFWATWCGVCKALKPRIEAAHGEFGDRVEFVIVAVSLNQTPQSVRDYMRDVGLTGRVVYDREGAALSAFAAPGTGYVVLVNEHGRVAYVGMGPSQDLRAAVASMLHSPD